MLFTWSTHNLCIVFPTWRISGPVSLFFSLLGVVALSAGYELVRELSRRYEARHSGQMNNLGGMFIYYVYLHHLTLPLVVRWTQEERRDSAEKVLW